jgi:hypothetical protein
MTMTDLSFDYVEAQKALDIGDRTDTKALATIARVHAQAAVDIAASLAMIVETLTAREQREWVAAQERNAPINDYVTVEGGGLLEPVSDDTEPSDVTEDASDAEPGDVVSDFVVGNHEVLEVGTTEGDVWLKLDGVKGKKWARDYVIIERGVGGDFDE